MEPQSYWVGLDLGGQESHICVVDGLGQPVQSQACKTSLSAILDSLSAFPVESIRLISAEAGTETHVLRKLREAGLPVAIFEARKASKFLAMRRNKTDANDARGLADMGRIGQHTVSQIYLKSLECQQLRSRLVMRQRLVKLRVTADGVLRSGLALYGRRLVKTRSAATLRADAEAHVASLKTNEGIDLSKDFEPIIELCERLRANIADLNTVLEAAARNHPVCRRFMGLTGVGPICALSFYSLIEDPDRFRRSSEVGAYLGLVPKVYRSGPTSFTEGISKTGSRMTRTHLFIAATVFHTRGPESDLKTWAIELEKRAGAKRARTALARKLAVILLTMWKTGASFEPFPGRLMANMT